MKQYLTLIIVLLSSIAFGQINSNFIRLETKSTTDTILTSNTEGNRFDFTNEQDIEFALFGAGSIKDLVSGNKKTENQASGSIGVAVYRKNKFQLIVGFSMNIKSEKEITDKAVFGQTFLNPDLSGQSFTFAYKRFSIPGFNETLGIQADLNISTQNWKIDSTAYNAIPIASRIGIVWRPFKESSKNGNLIGLEFFGGYTGRALIGNLKAQNAFVRNIIPKTNYQGMEIEASLILNSTTIFARLPWIISENHIDNLTGGQLVIGATINAELFEFK